MPWDYMGVNGILGIYTHVLWARQTMLPAGHAELPAALACRLRGGGYEEAEVFRRDARPGASKIASRGPRLAAQDRRQAGYRLVASR